MYICIYSNRDGEIILFHHEGGIDIGDVDSKALTYTIIIDDPFDVNKMENALLKHVPANRRPYVKKKTISFIQRNFFLFNKNLDIYQNLLQNYFKFIWNYNLLI